MFGTSAMREVFSDGRGFRSWLETEVALARAEAKVGLIPADVPNKIAHAAKLENLDIPAMKAAYEKIGFPILPMVKQLAAACPPDAARCVHWGATTQGTLNVLMPQVQ